MTGHECAAVRTEREPSPGVDGDPPSDVGRGLELVHHRDGVVGVRDGALPVRSHVTRQGRSMPSKVSSTSRACAVAS